MYKSKYKKASSRIKRRSKIKHFFNLFLFVGLPVFILALVVFILRADFMQIKDVEVSGNVVLSVEEIKKVAQESLMGNYYLFIPKSNMLFFDENKLSSEILDKFKRVESVEVSTGVDGLLSINLKERVGQYLWCSIESKCFLMSDDGLVFVEADVEEILGKLVFRGGITGDPLTQHFADSDKMKNYLGAVKVLNDASLTINFINQELKDKAVFNTNIGDIVLNPEENMSLSAKNAILLIEETKAKNPSATFDYIDARFGNKMFYKLK